MAPLRLTQLALPDLRRNGGTVISITSDAAIEGYEGWGGYGASKAALEQMSNVLAAEEPASEDLLGGPRGHAHHHASGCVPRRGHLLTGRSPRPVSVVSPNWSRAASHRAATGSKICSAVDASDRTHLPLPEPIAGTEPAEERGSGRDDVRLMVSRAGSRPHASPIPRPALAAGTGRRPRGQHIGDAACRPRGDDGGWGIRPAPPLHPHPGRLVGGRAAPSRWCGERTDDWPTDRRSPAASRWRRSPSARPTPGLGGAQPAMDRRDRCPRAAP